MNRQIGKPDRGLTRRELIKGVGLAGATLPLLPAMPAEGAGVAADATSLADMVDVHFASASGRRFGSQIIHHGEQR